MSKITELCDYLYNDNHKALKSFNKEEKELMLSETDESTSLVQRELVNTIWKGAEQRRVFRNFLPVMQSPKMYGTTAVYVGHPNEYATKVSEGSAMPENTLDYQSVDIDLNKFTVGVSISNEMLEDGKFELVEYEIGRAGMKIENSINQLILSALLDGTTNSAVDPTTALDYADIGAGYKTISNLKWNPTDVILHPMAIEDIISDNKSININFNNGNLYGMNTHLCDIETTADATSYWDDTDAANHYFGLVLDRYNCGIIAIRDDLDVDSVKDFVHDITSFNVSTRAGFGVTNSTATCGILTV